MKRFTIAFICTIGCIALHAQGLQQSGIITFKDLRKLDLQVEGNASNFSYMLPDEITSEKELLFNEETAVYKNKAEQAEANETMGDENTVLRISTNSPDHVIYTDLSKGKTLERKEFMSRKFLIEGALESRDWKLTGNQKMILDLPCQEAVTAMDSEKITAWFTPTIPVSAGPEDYTGLPGMILEVNIDNGNHRIFAEQIEIKMISEEDLEKPRKGKKVTAEEFDRIVAEKVKEQGGHVEGGRMMMIEIRED